MEYYQKIGCPECGQSHLKKAGKSATGVQRYSCLNNACKKHTFMLQYVYKACEPGIKKSIIDMTLNASGIRDIGRVLKVARSTIIRTIKKKSDSLVQVNPNFEYSQTQEEREVSFKPCSIEVEADEQWSFVEKKSNQRWIWYAVDHATNTILAYAFGKRKDAIFKVLKDRLSAFNISRYYTDDWGAYQRNLEVEAHEIGKKNTQKIERKNLNLRTWIKRLTRKTICFSKSEKMHDTVIGLLINKVEFGIDIHA